MADDAAMQQHSIPGKQGAMLVAGYPGKFIITKIVSIQGVETEQS